MDFHRIYLLQYNRIDKISDYYQGHSSEYIGKTKDSDMSAIYLFVEPYMKEAKKVLDLGFGSGRDSLYFLRLGYDVYSLDNCPEFIRHGQATGLPHLIQQDIKQLDYTDEFDFIFASASLLHIPSVNLVEVLSRCRTALTKKGFLYASFKYGVYEGIRDGRYYADMTEKTIEPFLAQAHLKLVDVMITDDVQNRDNQWLNIIVKSVH